MMKEKTRFKLHKVKKQWMAIAVTSLALAAILSGAHLTQAEEQSGGGTDSKPRLTATVQESSEQPVTEAPAADSSVENNSANAVKSSETAEAAEVSDGGRASQTEAVTNQTNSEEHHPAEKATAVSGEAQSVQNAALLPGRKRLKPNQRLLQKIMTLPQPIASLKKMVNGTTKRPMDSWQPVGRQLMESSSISTKMVVRSKEKFMWRQGIKLFIILFS